ncbi:MULTISPECIES: hypothetical protein [Bacillus cereus group]|uniref:hypothetical protein n=1 Tax=Bacillus cereus group TaxID=86661 RepID=UPI0008FDD90E|nr:MULTISPECIES: hypothetical protein [Bacillus cereus group]OJD89584.1 hypothetical protein MCCC1A01412_15755 [Bacillus anthracis]OPA38137.1 hypothetical protein BHL07_18930 [Bacillus cereus]
MNLNEELKIILRYKKLLPEAYSIGGDEEIKFIRNGHIYMYFAITSPYNETRYYLIDDSLDTYQLKGNK